MAGASGVSRGVFFGGGGARDQGIVARRRAEVQALRQIAQEVDSLRQGAESLREAAQSVDRIDAAIFSGDARAQSEVVAEMARANPAAFRSMFAEAAKVLAGMEARGRGRSRKLRSSSCK